MRLYLLIITLMLSFGNLSAQQFRLIGNPSGFPSDLGNGFYELDFTFAADQTGNGFLPTQILTGGSYRMFFQDGKVYTIDDTDNETFSSATLILLEYGATSGPPSGQGVVYDPQGRETVPQGPANATGASPLLNSVISTYNLQFDEVGGGSSTKYVTLNSGDLDITLGYEGDSIPTLTVNAAGDYTVNTNTALIISVDVFGNSNTLTGTGDFIIRVDLTNANRNLGYSIFNATNGAAVDEFTQGNNPSRSFASSTVSLSFPNMQPYGAGGFEILLR